MLSLGQAIRVQRLLLRMTQEEVADQANVTRAWLSRVEMDQISTPGFEAIERVARVLGVPPERWLERAGYKVTAAADTPESVGDFIRQAQSILAEALERVERIQKEPASTTDESSSVRRLSLAVAAG